MSCYLVTKSTIDAILSYALKHNFKVYGRPLTVERNNELGLILWQANQDSVDYRYKEKSKPVVYTFSEKHSYRNAEGKLQYITAQTVISLLSCLRYQSCEVSGYFDTQPYVILQELLNSAVFKLVQDNNEPWGLND